MSSKGKLFLIPCPLAENSAQQVLPSSVIAAIASTAHFLVENERTARRFISSLKLGLTIENLTFTVLDKDSVVDFIEPVVKKCLDGHHIGVISEAGCPGVADPGALAVAVAHRLQIEVCPLVGPNSLLLALMGSGLNGQSFAFNGYLPIDRTERIKQIRFFEKEAIQKNQSQLFIETPYRNQSLLADLVATLNGSTKLCVAVDVTAPTQLIQTRTANEWKKISIDLHKRPVVFIFL